MNTESINLTENPSDFVEPYFIKKHELLVTVPYSVNFIKKTLDFVKIILKSINFKKNPLNFSVINLVALAARERGHVGSKNISRRIAIRRLKIDRDVNFAKKSQALLK